jgi:hypothetical protein
MITTVIAFFNYRAIQKKLFSRPNVLSVSYHFLEIAWTAAVKASSGRLAGKEIFFFQTWSQD